ncbi:MAG: hypothetical protein AB1700_07955, partial [Bacillota bacterium]
PDQNRWRLQLNQRMKLVAARLPHLMTATAGGRIYYYHILLVRMAFSLRHCTRYLCGAGEPWHPARSCETENW